MCEKKNDHENITFYVTFNVQKVLLEQLVGPCNVLITNLSDQSLPSPKGCLYCGEPPDQATVWSGYYSHGRMSLAFPQGVHLISYFLFVLQPSPRREPVL